MKTKAIGVAWLLVMALLAGSAWGQAVGSVTVAIGPVQIFHAGAAQGAPAKQAMEVRLGDRIETGAGGRVKVFLTKDNSVLQVGEQSSFVIDALEYSEATKTHRAVFRLLAGKVRVIINRVFGIQTDAKVETPTAVAGVTGTTLIMGHDPRTKTSTVLTVDGTVRVTGGAAKKLTGRDVAKGEITFVPQGDAPRAPRPATAQEVAGLLGDTEVPGPPPADLSKLEKRSLTDNPEAISAGEGAGGGAMEPTDAAERKRSEEIGLEPAQPGPPGSKDAQTTVDPRFPGAGDAQTTINPQFPGAGGAQTNIDIQFPAKDDSSSDSSKSGDSKSGGDDDSGKKGK